MKKLFNTKTQDGKMFIALGAITVILLVCCVAPIGIYNKHIIIQTMFYAYMATAWNLMCGYTGRLSLGHSAYIAVAAYTSLILSGGPAAAFSCSFLIFIIESGKKIVQYLSFIPHYSFQA